MRMISGRFVALLLVSVLVFSMTVSAAPAETEDALPYRDLSDQMWGYQNIAELYQRDILPSAEYYYPDTNETRAGFVSLLYAMHLALGGSKERGSEAPFSDVPAESEYHTAVLWAKNSGIVNGVSETEFAPNANLTREHICTILVRYARIYGVALSKQFEAKQFKDSLSISAYARTPIVACQMSGIVNGYTNGYFHPERSITRQECAAVIYRLLNAAENRSSSENVLVEEGAYDSLYEGFRPLYQPPVSAGEAVDLSYFDNVAFVGDSVSQMLQFYCAATGALGNATFLCAQSLSATNALMSVSSSSVHPSYQGTKMTVEEGVQASGVKIVYIMLGMNNVSFGIDNATNDMLRLVERIKALSPDVEIVIQSVTPMVKGSGIETQSLNNVKINAYNLRMREICSDQGWYYLEVAEAFKDAEGYLIPSYCSDNPNMGIHFTNQAAGVWVDYLKTHVPDDLLKIETEN